AGRDRAGPVPDRLPGAAHRWRAAARTGDPCRHEPSARFARRQRRGRLPPQGRTQSLPGTRQHGAARDQRRRRGGHGDVRRTRCAGPDPADRPGTAVRRGPRCQADGPACHRPRATRRARRAAAARAAPRRNARRRVPGVVLAAQHASPDRGEAAPAACRGGRRTDGLTMAVTAAGVRTREGARPGALPLPELLEGGEPVLLKGLVRDWSLVAAGRESSQAAIAHLLEHSNGRPLPYSWGPADTAGRPFYDDSYTRLNTEARRGTLEQVLGEIQAHLEDAR